MTPEERMRDATEAEAKQAEAELQAAIARYEEEPLMGRLIDKLAAEDHVRLLHALTKREEELELEHANDTEPYTPKWYRRSEKKQRLRHAKQRAETLTWLNEMRAGLGLSALKRLPVGISGDSSDCVVARGLRNGWAISTGNSESTLTFTGGEQRTLLHPTYVSRFISAYDEDDPDTGLADLSAGWLRSQDVLTDDEYELVAHGTTGEDGTWHRLTIEEVDALVDAAWARWEERPVTA